MPHERLETLLGAEAQMALLGYIVPLDALPQEVVRRRGLGNLQAVDLDVGEGVDFLVQFFFGNKVRI